jgi:hypothetical protein
VYNVPNDTQAVYLYNVHTCLLGSRPYLLYSYHIDYDQQFEMVPSSLAGIGVTYGTDDSVLFISSGLALKVTINAIHSTQNLRDYGVQQSSLRQRGLITLQP